MGIVKSPVIMISNAVSLLSDRIPGQVIIQYTDSCNAKCPQCGMRVTEKYQRSKLAKEEIKKIIDSASTQGVQALSFTGGEPFIYEEELLELIKYAGEKNIEYIRTGTNGFIFMGSEKADFKDRIKSFAERLSNTRLRNFWISIDSADVETHESMRGLKGVIRGVEKALPIFHEFGIYPSANLGINRNIRGFGRIPGRMQNEFEFYLSFRNGFKEFYSLVINLGFTMVNACYPMSIGSGDGDYLQSVYGATSLNEIVSFSKAEKVQIFSALLDTMPEYRERIRIFTPQVSLFSLIKQYEGNAEYGFPCRGGIDFFFIDARDGSTYPCGFRALDNMGKFYNMDVKSIREKPFCRSCDWECFRDPSELLSYMIHGLRNPAAYIMRKVKDEEYHRLWKEDMEYYRKCDYFDGRKAPRL